MSPGGPTGDGAACAPPLAAEEARDGRLWGIFGRLLALLWFVFLVPPVVNEIQARGAIDHRVLVLILVGLFVGLYAALMAGRAIAVYRPQPWHLPAVAVLAVVACATTLAGGSQWIILMIFVSAASATLQPPGRAWLAVGASAAIAGGLVGVVRADPFGHGVDSLAELVAEVAAIGAVVVSVSQMLRANARLRAAQATAVRLAAAEERLRLARDVHDLVGHSLAVVVRKSELAGRLAGVDPGRTVAEIRAIEAIARDALRDVRELVTAPPRPRLATELQGARLALESAGSRVTVEGDPNGLPEPVDEALAWAVREAATNVLRHTRAHAVTMRIARGADGGVSLEVVDGGPAVPRPADARVPGSGLAGLAERARDLGGALEAGPSPEGGFRLAVALPALAAGRAAT